MEPPVDPTAVRLALERQLAMVTPVAEHLLTAARQPPTVGASWRGVAAGRASDLASARQQRTREAAHALDDRVRELRVTIATLS